MKRLLPLMMALLATTISTGQHLKVSPGIKFSYILSEISPDFTDTSYNMIRYHFRLAGGYRFGGFIVLEPGKKLMIMGNILFSYKRAVSYKYYNGNQSQPNREFWYYSFIEVPVSVFYKLPLNKSQFYCGGGVNPAFPIWAYLRNSDKPKIGWNLATGIKTRNDFYFQFDITSHSIPKGVDLQPPKKARMKSFGLTIGYSF